MPRGMGFSHRDRRDIVHSQGLGCGDTDVHHLRSHDVHRKIVQLAAAGVGPQPRHLLHRCSRIEVDTEHPADRLPMPPDRAPFGQTPGQIDQHELPGPA